MKRTFVVAEFGVTHDGQYAQAVRLIQAAAQAGADAAKGQFWSDSKRLADRRNAPELAERLEPYRMPENWLKPLMLIAAQAGIEFMCTVYIPEDIPTVAGLVQRMKIASLEAQDLAFVRAHRATGKQTLISTGCCDEAALGRLQELKDQYFGQWDVRLLLCTSAYPAPLQDVNLRAIRTYDLDGFSDHTPSRLTGALAVAAGARIVEKHLRLEETNPANPDFPHSLPPEEFREYVAHIRSTEEALGDGRKRIQASEAAMQRYVVRGR